MFGCKVLDYFGESHGAKVNDIIERGRTLHFVLDWLIDSGFDLDLSFSLSEQCLEYPWERLTGAPMAVYPSILFPLTSCEFIGGELQYTFTILLLICYYLLVLTPKTSFPV